MKYNDIFNSDTLNIFTDASTKKLIHNNGYEETISSPGWCIVDTDDYNNINHIVFTQILRYSTNNHGEITAIEKGINSIATNSNKYKTINLFSDSKICILGLKEWIFDWISKSDTSRLIGSSGEVSNQECFKRIINLICDRKIEINFYHQKGHVNVESQSSLINATNVFNTSNKVNVEDLELIKTISYFNDIVDKSTKDALNNCLEFISEDEPKLFNPFSINLKHNTIDTYRKLINKGR